MLDYKRIIALRFGNGLSGREIALSCGCSKTAVNEFLRRFKDCPQLSLPLGKGAFIHSKAGDSHPGPVISTNRKIDFL